MLRRTNAIVAFAWNAAADPRERAATGQGLSQLPITVGSYEAFNTVSTRGVQPIGVAGVYGSSKLLNMPTLVEQGMEERLVKLEGGLPLTAPAGTPEPILKFLADVVVAGSGAPNAMTLRATFGVANKPQNLEVPVWIEHAQDLEIKLD